MSDANEDGGIGYVKYSPARFGRRCGLSSPSDLRDHTIKNTGWNTAPMPAMINT